MTVIKHNAQRVGVFIDTQNLYHSAKNLFNKRVNYTEVMDEAVADRVLVRAIGYVITTESGEETPFFESLESLGIETKTKDLQIFTGGAKKADWDVGIAVDAINLAAKLDVVVLVTGDGDFIPLVKYLQQQGCQVEVISFAKSSSAKLLEVIDDFVDLAGDTKRFLIGSARASKARSRRSSGGAAKASDQSTSEPKAKKTRKPATKTRKTKS